MKASIALALSLLIALMGYEIHVFGKLDYNLIVEHGNYTCDELVRWLGTEKHYSNDKKNIIFGLMREQDCPKQPFVMLQQVSYGTLGPKRTFFSDIGAGQSTGSITTKSKRKCSLHDNLAVAFLSNYSINNNFSHFLHSLLRLFCALLDAHIIVWNAPQEKFTVARNYTLWLDEYFKLSPDKEVWLKSFGGSLRSLAKFPKSGDCISSNTLIYGSGCVRLLPPEKWFGYPGCRAGNILGAFGTYMRQVYTAVNSDSLRFVDNIDQASNAYGLRVAFAVRDVGAETGKREISNLDQVQTLIRRTQHVRSSMENVTFEHLDVPSTVRYMAGVHIFVSVHGAGMTNMFFMNPGAAVVEIIPYPLCNCRSPDYFYGVGGYYHGSSVAQGLKHYHYCVPPAEMKWHKKPEDIKPGSKCSWRHLHAVESVYVDPTRFVSLMRMVERDLVVAGTIVLTKPIINVSPHANG